MGKCQESTEEEGVYQDKKNSRHWAHYSLHPIQSVNPMNLNTGVIGSYV